MVLIEDLVKVWGWRLDAQMKKILLYISDEIGDEIFTGCFRDNCNAPFIHLKKRLSDLGYDLCLLRNGGLPDECEWIWFLNAGNFTDFRSPLRKMASGLKRSLLRSRAEGKKDLLAECINRGMGDRIALFLWEGQAVSPQSYSKQLHAAFPIIFTWNDDLVDSKKYIKFHLPLPDYDSPPAAVLFDKKKLLVNVSINKHSAFSRELYSARKKTIFYFDKYYPADFDLYGRGWESYAGRLKCLRGEIQRKKDILPNYKFCLAYENMQGERGYITEKIFDAMQCGTVPVYWGASNIDKYVDPRAFVDRRMFKSDAELARFLSDMTEREYKTYSEAIAAYLDGEKYSWFLPEHFANTIINTFNLAGLKHD